MADASVAALSIMEGVREYMARALTPLAKKIADLEASVRSPKSVTGALIDRSNVLILTMSDGSKVELGVVVGQDGADVDMAAVGQAVREEVAKAVAPLLEARGEEHVEPVTEAFIAPIIDKALARAVAALPRPENGKDADPAETRRLVDMAVKEAVAAIPAPKDGESVTLEQARPVIEAAVRDAVAALPTPKDGKNGADADMAVIREEIRLAVAAKVADIPVPRDGIDVDMDELEAKIRAAVAIIPTPKDGQSVTLADVEPMIKAAVAEAAAALPVPKDGVGLAGAVIDRDGSLVVTLTNGEARSLGRVVGKDADMAALKAAIGAEVAALPKPRDGVDGRDGINWDDLTVAHDGARTVTFRYQRGDKVKEFAVSFPAVIYRGVFDNAQKYAQGDLVSWDGSLWHCNAEEAKARPGDGGADWKLAVKKGRDGKDFDRPARPTDPRIKS